MGGEEEEGVGEEEEVGEEEGGEGEGEEQDVREEVEEGEEEEEEESFLDPYPDELYPETLGEAADPDPDPDLDPDLDPGAGRKEAGQHSHEDTTRGQGGQQVRQQGFWPRLSPLASPRGPGLLVPSLALASPLISHQAWAARQRAGRATPLSGPHLAQLAWALGAAGLRPGPLFVTAFCRQVADSHGGMDGNALADVLAALPSMLPPPSTPPPANLDHTFSHLDNDLPHLASSLKDFESRAWEEAHACIEEVCGVICERCMECLPDMEPDAVAKVLLSLVRLNCPPPPGLLPLVTSTTASQLAAYSACGQWTASGPACSLAVEWQRLCSRAPPSRLARLAWALARLRVKLPPALMHDLLVAARAQFKVMEDNDLVSIVWSLASLRHRPGPLWLSALCQESRARLAQWPAHSLVEVMWALALFSHTPPPEWLQAVEVVLVDRWLQQWVGSHLYIQVVQTGASGSGQHEDEGQGQGEQEVIAERRQVIKAAFRALVEAARPDLSPAQVDAVVAQLDIEDPNMLPQLRAALDLLTNASVQEHMMRGPHHSGIRLLPAVGVDPGVTQAIKAAHAQRHAVTGQVLRQWEWELTKGQLKHDSGLTKAKQNTARWSADIHPQLQQLAAATPAGTTLDGLHAHILALKACWDPLWEECLKPRWRRQEPSSASLRPYARRPDRLVIVDEFRTSRVSSSVHTRQPCELHLPPNQPRPANWVPSAGQLDRDTNLCLNFQRIGESKQRPLEVCSWKDLEALPPIGKEYHQRYKLVNDRLPKVRQRLHRAAEYWRGSNGRARNNA
ncbi:hypothetical protein QJQ45_001797 [Haematococcus lacustris]|nr:hypothetical protein QJQ45_001797 [Haematococcus lacustris]